MKEQLKFYEYKLAFEIDSADLFENLSTNTNIVVVDTRKQKAYEEAHIPGAISFPHNEINIKITKDLDASKTYICYCDGIGCNGSTKGVLKMTKLGFKTKELLGGLAWWKRDGYATEGNIPGSSKEVTCTC